VRLSPVFRQRRYALEDFEQEIDSPSPTVDDGGTEAKSANNVGTAANLFLPRWARLRTPPSVLMLYFGHDPSSSDKVIEHRDEASDIVRTDTLLGTFSGESLNEIK